MNVSRMTCTMGRPRCALQCPLHPSHASTSTRGPCSQRGKKHCLWSAIESSLWLGSSPDSPSVAGPRPQSTCSCLVLLHGD